MKRCAWALSAAALLGCGSAQEPIAATPTTDASAAPVESGAPTRTRRAAAEDLLDDGVADRHPLRTWLIANEPLVYAEGRPAIAKGPTNALTHAVEAIVVEQVGEHMRVVLDGHDVRLLVLAPPSCTARAVKRAAWLWTLPEARPSEGEGVRLAPGVRLIETEVRGVWRHVRGDADGVAFDGWLDAASIDRAFVAAPFVAGSPDALVLHDAMVTDSAGQLLVHLPGPPTPGAPRDFELLVETGPKSQPGLKHIIYKNKAVEVRGWVRDADYKPLPPDAGLSTHGSGWGDGGGMSGHTTARLAAGTSLYDEEDARVGVVKNESTFYLRDRSAMGLPDRSLVPGWIHVTGIGFVLAYAHAVDLRLRQ